MQSYWVMKGHCSSPHPPFWHCNYLKYVNHRAFVFLTEPSLGSARRAFCQVNCKSIPAKWQENVTRGPNSFKRKRLLEINLRIVVFMRRFQVNEADMWIRYALLLTYSLVLCDVPEKRRGS